MYISKEVLTGLIRYTTYGILFSPNSSCYHLNTHLEIVMYCFIQCWLLEFLELALHTRILVVPTPSFLNFHDFWFIDSRDFFETNFFFLPPEQKTYGRKTRVFKPAGNPDAFKLQLHFHYLRIRLSSSSGGTQGFARDDFQRVGWSWWGFFVACLVGVGGQFFFGRFLFFGVVIFCLGSSSCWAVFFFFVGGGGLFIHIWRLAGIHISKFERFYNEFRHVPGHGNLWLYVAIRNKGLKEELADGY